MKTICGIVLSIISLFGGNMVREEVALNNFEFSVSQINVYDNGCTYTFSNQDKEFLVITTSFLEMMEGHHEMPAFGVAIHSEIKSATTKGLWVEFVFDGEKIYNDMPFSKLLIEVNEEFTGFNIIRFQNGEYSGRCFYIDLVGKSMSGLYKTIKNL